MLAFCQFLYIIVIGFIGSFATLSYEPRQDRKVATVVILECAEDVLMKSFFCPNFDQNYFILNLNG